MQKPVLRSSRRSATAAAARSCCTTPQRYQEWMALNHGWSEAAELPETLPTALCETVQARAAGREAPCRVQHLAASPKSCQTITGLLSGERCRPSGSPWTTCSPVLWAKYVNIFAPSRALQWHRLQGKGFRRHDWRQNPLAHPVKELKRGLLPDDANILEEMISV